MPGPDPIDFAPPKSRVWPWLLGVGGILAAAVVYSMFMRQFLQMQLEKNPEAHLAANVRQMLEEYAEQRNAVAEGLSNQADMLPPKSNLQGDHRVVDELFRAFLNDMLAVQNEYLAALRQAGWPEILDTNRLQQDRGMEQSQQMLASVELAVAEYRATSEAVYETLATRADAAPFSTESARNEFQSGLLGGMIRGRATNKSIWDYEEEIVRSVGDIIELLARTEGHFQINRNDEFRFDAQSDTDLYNESVARIDVLVREQGEIQRRSTESALWELKGPR